LSKSTAATATWCSTGSLVASRDSSDGRTPSLSRATDFGYAEGAVDELFDKTETDALVAYLEREHGGAETTIEEVNLPLPGNCWGYGDRAVGGSDDFYMLAEEPEYSLPFRVWGYYDLEGCEPVDKSVPARHQFASIYVVDGKVITDYDELLSLWRAGKIVAPMGRELKNQKSASAGT
jgi:hypothetical protein